MFAIYKKELRSYFINAIGYVYVGVFLAVSALMCCYSTLIAKSYDTGVYFTMLLFSFIVLIPLLTMKLFAEEKKLRTEQLLLTAPISIWSMVLGKFLAAVTLFAGTVLVSCINLFPLYIYANMERLSAEYEVIRIGPSTPEIISCVIGVILVGLAFISIGLFVSSLTENQLAAAVITIATVIAFIGIGIFSSFIDVYAIRLVLSWISITGRFSTFAKGVFDIGATVYFASLAFVFLFLTVRIYEKRRWS